ARALRHRDGAARRARLPRADGGGLRAAGRDAGARPALLDRLARGGGAARLRALAGQPRRSLAPRRGVLQRQWLHRRDRAGRRRRWVVVVAGVVDPNAARVRAMFTRIARRYDIMNTIMTGGRHHAWRRLAAGAVVGAPPGPVLDLATGTGDLALAVRAVRPSSMVVGVDFSEGMLSQARPKLARRRETRVPLLAADALALPVGVVAYRPGDVDSFAAPSAD